MLKIVSGNIIENAKKYEVEAIVNPNNKYMDYGCGYTCICTNFF